MNLLQEGDSFKNPFPRITKYLATPVSCLYLSILAVGCNEPASQSNETVETQILPVITVTAQPATTHKDFASKLEGKVNVEIRPRVEGYLEQIFVDEGAYVKQGQPLFKINEGPYREQLSNASASLQAAIANQAKAQVDIDRLTPLVQNNVVSEVQLRTAQSSFLAAKAGSTLR